MVDDEEEEAKSHYAGRTAAIPALRRIRRALTQPCAPARVPGLTLTTMAPRTPADPAAPAPEPRRSGRLAGTAPAELVEPAAPAPAKKKRAGTAAGAGASKKAKTEKAAEEETEAVAPGADADPPAAKAPPLALGDVLPALVLKNAQDADVDVASLAADQGLVLFLVPKADTPGCTIQACGFRDAYPDFGALGYTVYCVSADTPAAQAKWQTKKELPYPLLSDRKRALIGALGAADGAKTKRSHFVFEKGGKLVERVLPVKPADSPRRALEFIKAHAAAAAA